MARRSHSLPDNGFATELVEAVLADALGGPGPTPVYAITGVQGSGKSTLAAQVAAAAKAQGLATVTLSIDDCYLTPRQRQTLGRQVHPLLATRGPPGTHDVALACQTLDALRGLAPGERVALPRFDKLADRRAPPSRWTVVRQRPDLIVFEGWFLKVPPEPVSALAIAINRLERDEDPDGAWRRYCNDALARYTPLWQRLDRLLWLRAPDFSVVPAWRWQQETALQAAAPTGAGMSRSQVERFVMLFERVSRRAQASLGAIADGIVEMDEHRLPSAIKRR